ncbi:unnamed protein product [Cunninghamella echinulata]
MVKLYLGLKATKRKSTLCTRWCTGHLTVNGKKYVKCDTKILVKELKTKITVIKLASKYID